MPIKFPAKTNLVLIGAVIGLFIGVTIQQATGQTGATTASGGSCENAICVPAGSSAQWRAGNLILNTSNQYANGLLVPYGNVGIGTITPTAKLEVAGKIKSQEFCIDDICLTKDKLKTLVGTGGTQPPSGSATAPGTNAGTGTTPTISPGTSTGTPTYVARPVPAVGVSSYVNGPFTDTVSKGRIHIEFSGLELESEPRWAVCRSSASVCSTNPAAFIPFTNLQWKGSSPEYQGGWSARIPGGDIGTDWEETGEFDAFILYPNEPIKKIGTFKVI